METCPGVGGAGGVLREKFPNSRRSSHQQVCGEFWNLRGQHNKEKKTTTKKLQNASLTVTPSGEVAQMLALATSESQGLGREAQAVCLR